MKKCGRRLHGEEHREERLELPLGYVIHKEKKTHLLLLLLTDQGVSGYCKIISRNFFSGINTVDYSGRAV
jgi:hypothetical protein